MMSKNKRKFLGKTKDLQFNYVLTNDPEVESWRALAANWFDEQIGGRSGKRLAIDKFLCEYIPRLGPAKFPQTFLLRNTSVPSIMEVLQGIQPKGATRISNHIHDFLSWVLEYEIANEDDNGHRVIPAAFHNTKNL